MTTLILRGQLAVMLTLSHRLVGAVADPTSSSARRGRGDHGQATAEYGLVLLGAAAIALLLVGWATKSGAIGDLFDTVMDSVIGKVK